MSSGRFPARYAVRRELARGGMGVVYEADDTALGRRVAIKSLLRVDPEELERLRREALAVAQLEHPHIVRVLDVGQESGSWYMVMELVAGRSLDDRLKAEGPLPEAVAARAVAQAAEAVGHVHRHGVLHRDLKPANLLTTADGQVKVADFGLVKSTGARAPRRLQSSSRLSEGLTADGEVVGTPAFMAPEQAQGEPLDERADVYALGATLYTLLTGEPPFSGQSAMAILARLVEEEPEPPSALRPGLDPELEAICLRAMAKDRADRTVDMRTLEQELLRWLRAQREPARGAATGSRAPLVIGSTLGALVLLGGLLFGGGRGREVERVEVTPVPSSPSPRPPPTPSATPTPAPPASATPDPAEARRARYQALLKRGSEALERKRSDEAFAIYGRAIEVDPRRPEAYYRRAHMHQAQGRHRRALAAFDQAVARLERLEWDRPAEVLRQRALSHAALGELKRAVADCGAALERDPRDYLAWTNRALLRLQLKDVAGARSDFETATRVDPEPARAWLGLGNLATRQRRYREALGHYDRALASAPNDRGALLNRGAIRRALRDPKGALRDYDRAARLYPRDALVRRQRGSLREATGDKIGAGQDYEASLQADPRQRQARLLRRKVRQFLGREPRFRHDGGE